MELNEEKKMKSEQAVLPNPCLEEEDIPNNVKVFRKVHLLVVVL
jgi:hypothetical protein